MPRVNQKTAKATVKKSTSTKSIKAPKTTSTDTNFPLEINSFRIRLESIKNNLINAVKNYNKLPKSTYIIIIVVGLLLLAGYKKSLFIAATVNGAPITNLQLLSRINDQYRDQTLNQMINEQIVLDAAKKEGVRVSDNDINTKISELEKNVGGPQALDSLLAGQGQTRSTLKDQIKLQLMIEKLYEKEATVSAEEVDKYITDNQDTLQATTSAEQTKEAETTLKQQKLSNIFRQKFQELRQKANIQIFK